MSEATIAVILGVVSAIYKFAARRLEWSGRIPTTLMLRSERPKIWQSEAPTGVHGRTARADDRRCP